MSEFEKSGKMEKEKIGKETVLVSPFGCRTGKNMYLRMLVFALFMLAAVGFLSSCGTTGKSTSPEEETTTTPTPEEPEEQEEPVESDGLSAVQTQASNAADAAMTASDAANVAAGAAELAGDMRANIQTGSDMYEKHLKDAEDEAAKALAAYNEANKQSDVAQAATTVLAALTAALKAEDARDDAKMAQKDAEEARDNAMMAAKNLLMIDDTMKSVGGTMLDATAGASTMTVGEGGDAMTTRTGEIEGMAPMTTVIAIPGIVGVQDDPTTPDTNEAVAHVQEVAEMMVTIGKVVDSGDDMARLMIVTSYAGSKMVDVFAYDEADDAGSRADGTQAGRISIDDTDTPDVTETNNVRLRSEGMFYLAGADGETDGLAADDIVAVEAPAMQVYSYMTAGSDGDLGTDDDVTNYVVLQSEFKEGDTTTYTYRSVDTMVTIPTNGGDSEAMNMGVKASLAAMTDYNHIHFGVWAALGDAENDGTQDPSDLGIGFVQSIGDGMTGEDMPNNGMGKYEGNWVAAVQVEDEEGNGAISLKHGAASLTAYFGKGEITADLMNLAMLKGDITGNTFSGDKASDIKTMYGLDADADFEGMFSGGFYGSQAAEAGGVFSFRSEDAEGGAFRGAFGADRKK